MSTELPFSFTHYFEVWLLKLEQILNELLEIKHRNELVVNDQESGSLVFKVETPWKEFYNVKWMVAEEDVLSFFSPIWLTQLETSFLWVNGPQPSMVFRVVSSLKQMQLVSVGPNPIAFELMAEQNRRIQELRIRSKAEEEMVEKERKQLHVLVATQSMVLGDAMADMGELVEGFMA